MNKNSYFGEGKTDEYSVRKEKVSELKNNNLSSWPNNFCTKKDYIIDLLNIDIEMINKELKQYILSGRITNIRKHGKSVFMHINDNTGRIQAYLKEDDNIELFSIIIKLFDIGDIIEFSGSLFLTKTGEKTIRISNAVMLAKCLHNIPDQHVGFENIESRYRKRYLDIIVHSEVKNVFLKRSLLVRHIRNFLDERGYLEVETPMLHAIPGGALARPFKTHHNALGSDFFLRIAPELFLKKLIVAGFDKVYEINKNFRNEGVSIRHNPEFTMLEFYTAYQNYIWAMSTVEEILRTACFAMNKSYIMNWGGHTINFEEQFDRINAYQALLKYTDFSQIELSVENINGHIDDINIQKKSYEEKIFYLFEKYAEEKLIKPTFLIDFPISTSPLAKADAEHSNIAARFELFICGMEISNGYNELNNPFDQSNRFAMQAALREDGDNEAMYYDSDFITALEYGMPPTTGVGIGIDRLCMLLTGAKTIKDVILFPTMKKILS